jgi:hypothetical protein
MAKRPLTAAENAAYQDLARAAAKLRKAQEAAERKRAKLQAAELRTRQRKARRAGKGVADA